MGLWPVDADGDTRVDLVDSGINVEYFELWSADSNGQSYLDYVPTLHQPLHPYLYSLSSTGWEGAGAPGEFPVPSPSPKFTGPGGCALWASAYQTASTAVYPQRPIQLDANGDGATDLLFLKPHEHTCAEGEESKGGKCWSTSIFLSMNGSDGQVWEQPLGETAIFNPMLLSFARAIDFNGDAYGDFVLPMRGACADGSDRTCYGVFAGTGDSSAPFVAYSTGIRVVFEGSPGDYNPLDKGGIVAVTDLDANGVSDLMVEEDIEDGEHALFAYVYNQPQKRVVRIDDGTNGHIEGSPTWRATTEIDYAPVVDLGRTAATLSAELDILPEIPWLQAAVDELDESTSSGLHTYSSRVGSANCSYPLSCVVGTRQVVSAYAFHDGVGGQRHYRMRYSNGRYDRRGHRWLGFGRRESLDVDTLAGRVEVRDNETYDADLHVYPFAGLMRESWEWKPALSDQIDNTELHVYFRGVTPVLVPSATGTYFTYTGIVHDQHSEGAVDPALGEGAVFAAVLDELIAPTNVVKSSWAVVANVDEHGNELASQTWTDGVDDLRTTTRVVENEDGAGAWRLGKELSRIECSTALGVTACRKLERTFNSYAEVATETVGDAGDISSLRTTTFVHDANGNPISVTSVNGHGDVRSTCTRFDAEGVFPVVTGNLEGHHSFTYFDRGSGRVRASVDPNGLATHLAYDPLGVNRREVKPDGTVLVSVVSREQIADSYRFVTTVTGSDGTWSRREADELGREVRSLTKAPDVPACSELGSCIQGATLVQETAFDALGREARRYNPYVLEDAQAPHYYTDRLFDALGREVFLIKPNGYLALTSYDGAVTTREDIYGVTVSTHDALSRTVSVTDALGTTTATTYGPFGDVWAVDAAGLVTTSFYDAYGRRTKVLDPDRGETLTEFNGFGEVRRQVDNGVDDGTPEGRATRWVRDGIGRVQMRIEEHEANGAVIEEISTFEYDTALHGVGRLAQSTSADGVSWSYTYTPLAQAESSTLTVPGKAPMTAVVAYDAWSRPVQITYPGDGSSEPMISKLIYDGHGKHVATKVTLLPASGGPSVTEEVWRLKEVDSGGRTRRELLGDVETVRDIDPQSGALIVLESNGPAGKVQNLEYHYSPRLDLDYRKDNLQLNVDGEAPIESFDYDVLGRLTCVRMSTDWSINSGGGGPCVQEVEYAPTGNITWKSDVGSYTYDPAHPRAVVAAGSLGFEYDDFGNQIGRASAGIEYTHFDKPRRYHLTGSQDTVELTYDAAQERVRKLSPETDTTFFGSLYQSIEHSGGEQEHLYHVFSRDRVVLTVRRRHTTPGDIASEAARFQHIDHLGSPDVETDADGGNARRVSFDAFGLRRDPDWWTKGPYTPGDVLDDFSYTGQREDPEIGVIDMNKRLYDPVVARFLQVDPHVLNPLSAESWNGYSYVLNKPTVLVDPTGMDPDAPEAIGSNADGSTQYLMPDGTVSAMQTSSDASGASPAGCGAGGTGLTCGASSAESSRAPYYQVGPNGCSVGDYCAPSEPLYYVPSIFCETVQPSSRVTLERCGSGARPLSTGRRSTREA
ncbi:MAG: RHS repeat-associated core domain-containing protein [Polyangiaceae bacterium]